MLRTLTLAAGWASIALAHGHVKEYIIDGVKYPAFDPSHDYDAKWNAQRIEWGFPKAKGGVGPVENVNGLDINCRFRPLQEPTIEAEARAGANVTFKWFDWFGNHKGPLLTVGPLNVSILSRS
jgi:lytic cellulose monooxygenase (C1-hydroxylating)